MGGFQVGSVSGNAIALNFPNSQIYQSSFWLVVAAGMRTEPGAKPELFQAIPWALLSQSLSQGLALPHFDNTVPSVLDGLPHRVLVVARHH